MFNYVGEFLICLIQSLDYYKNWTSIIYNIYDLTFEQFLRALGARKISFPRATPPPLNVYQSWPLARYKESGFSAAVRRPAKFPKTLLALSNLAGCPGGG